MIRPRDKLDSGTHEITSRSSFSILWRELIFRGSPRSVRFPNFPWMKPSLVSIKGTNRQNVFDNDCLACTPVQNSSMKTFSCAIGFTDGNMESICFIQSLQ